VVLDLGRTVHGRLQAEVNGPEGSILDIGWDERLWTDARRPLPFRGSLFPLWNQVDSWVLDGSSRSISTIDARAGRYILVAAWGSKSVQLSNIRVLEERYPITQVGSFHSSDPVLDTIWQVGVDTLMPNMTDSYTDTPWRERAFYLGDAYVEYQVNRVSFGDTGLIRRGLLQAATLMRDDQAPGMVPNNNGLHMLDYSMLWVQTLADYLQDTEDADLPGEMLTPLRQFMDHLVDHEDPLTGLLDLSEDQWGNTGYVDTYGYYSRFGQSTAVNAIYYATLLRAAEIAERGGDSGAADRWRAKAAALKEQLNQVLYLPDQDRYVTHIFAGQAYTPTLYAQAWPLAYGLAPEGKSSRVADALLEMIGPDPADPNIGTYGMNWVIKGLGEAGYISQALDVIRLYYGHMLDSGATTWWESFDSNLYPQNSFSHAWAASPTWFLTTYVLGAQRTGQNSWLVKPSFESLDSASGALPLGHGALSVAWQRSDCNVSQSWNIHLDLLAPQGTRGEVVIPYRGAGLILALDHQDVWEAGASLSANVAALDDGIHLLLPGGSHQVEASEACIP
jgi:alpha-L-rhamnosidase